MYLNWSLHNVKPCVCVGWCLWGQTLHCAMINLITYSIKYYQSGRLPDCVSVYSPACLYVHLSVCLNVCPPVRLSVRLPAASAHCSQSGSKKACGIATAHLVPWAKMATVTILFHNYHLVMEILFTPRTVVPLATCTLFWQMQEIQYSLNILFGRGGAELCDCKDKTRQDRASQAKIGQCQPRQDKKGKTRQRKTRKDKARQDETRTR